MYYCSRNLFIFLDKKTPLFHLIIDALNTSEFNKLSKRDKEVVATQRIIRQHYPNEILSYKLNKAPILASGRGISISHSSDFLAILITPHAAAVDIEKISDKTKRVAAKFLSIEEQKWANTKELTTLCWCAKECLYKIYQNGSLNFANDLSIHSINNHTIKSSIHNQEYILHYEKFSDNYVVYYFD